MSRPTRYSGKQSSYTNDREQNRYNGVEAAPASALNKARAQFNEPLTQLQAIFPDWKEEDLLSVLEEVRGDIETAIARISEGHAEQWGSVKHKKEKKLPTHRERERERDGQSHTSPRGSASPRGRLRGGRGAGGARQQRERTSNHAPPVRGQEAPYTADTDPQIEATDGEVSKSSYNNDNEPHQQHPSDPIVSILENSTPEPTFTTPIRERTTSSTVPFRRPQNATGMSWAQITKPQNKTTAPDTPGLKPKEEHVTEPHPKQQLAREEPTTVEAPSWDDEPVSSSVIPPASTQEPTQTEIVPSSGDVPKAPSLSIEDDELLPPAVDDPVRQQSPPKLVEPEKPQEAEPVRVEAVLSPPPGLASPPVAASPSRSKTSTPTNLRPTIGVHRPNSRFKSDQVVIIPNQGLNPTFGNLPLQFGSLNINEEGELTKPVTPSEGRAPEQRSVTHAETLTPSSDLQVVNDSKVSISYASGSSPKGLLETIAPVPPNEGNGSLHTQAPPIDPALATAPTLNHPFVQQQPQQQIPTQHSLAGLTHTPQQSSQSAPGLQQNQSYGQAPNLPSQQGPYETGLGISALSHLSQLSHSQNQAYFRQSDSPFYNQPQAHAQDSAFGSSNVAPGGFTQTNHSAYSASQTLNPEFGFDNQRNAYGSYGLQNTFAGRGLLRHDEKGLAGASSQHLGIHPGPGAQGQPGANQGTGGQSQAQYPGMAHLANPFYYNMNMNPYGYSNQFYSPAFTSFVNPIYQPSGNSTPPHGSKPSMPSSSGAGGPAGGGQYAGVPGHLHQGSNGYDGEQASNGSSTYHQGSSLSTDFSKPYQGGQGFLGSISSSSGPGARQATSVPNPGVSGPSSAPSDQPFKGYGSAGAMQAGLATPDKGMPPSRIPPGLGQNQPQFYGNRFQSSVQGQGFQNPGGQGPQQNEGYYGYQRW